MDQKHSRNGTQVFFRLMDLTSVYKGFIARLALTRHSELLYVLRAYSAARALLRQREAERIYFLPVHFWQTVAIVCSTAEFLLQSAFPSKFRRNTQ